MGNCQAAEMATAVVECPGGRVERVMDLQGAVSAQRLMSAYPGYFVALISSSIVQPAPASTHSMATPSLHTHTISSISNPAPSFKLLAADAPLLSGHRYRLLSFEEVLTCFSQQGGHACTNLGRGRPVITTNANKPLASKHPQLREGRAQSSLNNHVVKIGC